jgi:hypothetical protein
MDGVHLEVVSHFINGMLRSSVEMELLSNEFGVSSEDISGDLGHKVVGVGIICDIKIDLDGMTVHVLLCRELVGVLLHDGLLVVSSIVFP